MKTDWDYSALATAYLKRPDYSAKVIEQLLAKALPNKKSANVCDVGAGTGHLTKMLAAYGCQIIALEPNDAMRELGQNVTADFSNVSWQEAKAEATGQADEFFDLVTFGSSFNVTDRGLALKETHRILRPGAWFACMWNHRDLEDPIQQGIEDIILSHVKDYQYGSRREDQRSIIEASGLFDGVQYLEGQVLHKQAKADCLEAWKSHATLARQAGQKFGNIIEAIESYLESLGKNVLDIPYTTRLWAAVKKN